MWVMHQNNVSKEKGKLQIKSSLFWKISRQVKSEVFMQASIKNITEAIAVYQSEHQKFKTLR